ncbi:hypothetical protein LK536_15825 [Lachnoclostridium pacaense]|uniref:hypothetical protein n=1 Tax=Enterocloster hominis (ex Hitch et al. 2024) TaxID=1917870 RepID=UPI001D12984F|nr:hypothetical protein [Lachnoclostridium pacaense]MCC2877745.1 hypothetical protein [Lachnoclostridium pacaense]
MSILEEKLNLKEKQKLENMYLGDKNRDQMFFASCDERICKLLHYKLNGCGIDFYELRERDFA